MNFRTYFSAVSCWNIFKIFWPPAAFFDDVVALVEAFHKLLSTPPKPSRSISDPEKTGLLSSYLGSQSQNNRFLACFGRRGFPPFHEDFQLFVTFYLGIMELARFSLVIRTSQDRKIVFGEATSFVEFHLTY